MMEEELHVIKKDQNVRNINQNIYIGTVLVNNLISLYFSYFEIFLYNFILKNIDKECGLGNWMNSKNCQLKPSMIEVEFAERECWSTWVSDDNRNQHHWLLKINKAALCIYKFSTVTSTVKLWLQDLSVVTFFLIKISLFCVLIKYIFFKVCYTDWLFIYKY